MPGVGAAPPIEAGTIIDEKFRVEQVIGEGGMGVVVRARHLRLGTPVALKFLLPEAAADATIVERFTREARAAARLTSDHVARVLDVGSTNDAPYMVMEFLDGESLGTALKRRGALPVDEACTIMIQVCEALQEAHSLGIVHRDLKPANLFLANRPNGKVIVKVLDFGISKIGVRDTETKVSDLTMATALLGTPHYMSPEQVASPRDVDARADIWSSGICLFRMISGRVPFDSDQLPELMLKIMRDPIPDVRSLRPDTPPAIAEIVLRCMQRDLVGRWRSAADLAAALSAYRDSASRLPASGLLLDGPTVNEAHEAALAKTLFPTPQVPQLRTNYVVYPPPGRALPPASSGQTGGGASRTMSGAPPKSSAASLAIAAIALVAVVAVVFAVVRLRATQSVGAAPHVAVATNAAPPSIPPPEPSPGAASPSAASTPPAASAPPVAVVAVAESAARPSPRARAPVVAKKPLEPNAKVPAAPAAGAIPDER